MAKGRLFFGGIPFEATEQEITDFFEELGYAVTNVEIKLDRDTQKSRGFGFADIDAEFLKQAIEDCDGQTFGHRKIHVNEAKPMENRGNGRSRR